MGLHQMSVAPIETIRPLTPDEIAGFHRDGLLFLRGLFAPDEIAPLQEACRADPSVDGNLIAVADSAGNAQEVVTWTELGDGLLGVLPRLARLVRAAEALIGRPVYHWHSKLSMKAPGSAGRWDWHQDYAYWYHEGCLLPDMLTCTVAVDRAFAENGCLQLLKGSHLMGRLEHPRIGPSSGADPERLALAMQRYERIACVLEPGDAVFFHSNTLHASGPNGSDLPRTLLHCSYNATDNSPFIAGQEHHAFRPLAVMPDDALRGGRLAADFRAQAFPFRGETGEANNYGYKLLRGSRPRPAS
jgi:ectoine hydroxylase